MILKLLHFYISADFLLRILCFNNRFWIDSFFNFSEQVEFYNAFTSSAINKELKKWFDTKIRRKYSACNFLSDNNHLIDLPRGLLGGKILLFLTFFTKYRDSVKAISKYNCDWNYYIFTFYHFSVCKINKIFFLYE